MPSNSQIVRAAVIQVAFPLGEVEENRLRLERIVEGLDGVDLVVAPELVVSGYDLDMIAGRGQEIGAPRDGPTGALISTLAVRKEMTIVVGIIERDEAGILYDSALIATPDGLLNAYRKSHLFPTEKERFAEGDELIVLDTPAGVLGPQICFEHAFPAISTALAVRGAQIIVIPSAVGAGYEHLLTLRSRARAQDNQVFVIAANLNTPGFCGHSLIADPKGAVLAAAGHDDEVLIADLDLRMIEQERLQEPSLRLAREALYRVDADAGIQR